MYYIHTYQARRNQGDIGDKSPVLFDYLFSKSCKMSRFFLTILSKFPVVLKTFRQACQQVYVLCSVGTLESPNKVKYLGIFCLDKNLKKSRKKN